MNNQNIFILGASGTGKSTVAAVLKQAIPNSHIVEAGAWARERFPKQPGMSVEQHVQYMSEQSAKALASDPLCAVNNIRDRCIAGGFNIIPGVRNPVDLAHLCVPTRDAIIWTNFGNPPPKSAFEQTGLLACTALVRFWEVTGQMPYKRLFYGDASGVLEADLRSWVEKQQEPQA